MLWWSSQHHKHHYSSSLPLHTGAAAAAAHKTHFRHHLSFINIMFKTIVVLVVQAAWLLCCCNTPRTAQAFLYQESSSSKIHQVPTSSSSSSSFSWTTKRIGSCSSSSYSCFSEELGRGGQQQQHKHFRWALQQSKMDDDSQQENNEDEDDEDNNYNSPPPMAPEKSRMIDYIADYLDKSNQMENEEKKENEKGGDSGDASSSSDDDQNKNPMIMKHQDDATHLIAIPMDTCHELLIELESVQRAILYHCPILVHACIVPATTRLPLLYVQTTTSSSSTTQSSSSSTNSRLTNIVRKLVTKHMFDSQRIQKSSVSSSLSEDDDDEDDNDESATSSLLPWSTTNNNDKTQQQQNQNQQQNVDDDWVNQDGIHPLTMTFQSLEVDGSNNNILNTVAIPNDSGTVLLQGFVKELIQEIQKEDTTWKISLPWDPNNNNIDSKNNKNDDPSCFVDDDFNFRPRIPFMELPTEFNDNIEKFKNGTLEITDDNVDALTSDQGGNGISPIFWAQWWDDIMGKNIRLPSVGIYKRQSSEQSLFKRTTEQGGNDFYLPYDTIFLPEGNSTMKQSEAKFQKYQDDRMEEEQLRQQREMQQQEKQNGNRRRDDGVVSSDQSPSSSSSSSSSSSEGGDRPKNVLDPYEKPDLLMSKTRERLEELYIKSGEKDVASFSEAEWIREEETVIPAQSVPEITDTTARNDDDEEEEDEDDEDKNEGKEKDDTSSSITASPDDFLSDWTRQRIQMVTEKRKELEKKKDNPPIQDNPVFQKYKDGTLVPKSQMSSTTTSKAVKDLPPYPSREHFIGIWRVVTSPTGFVNEEVNEDKSENLILRVDGTTAGGPILDQETKQKAAGGTWTMLLDEEVDDYNTKNARLRIRLVIPPKKERILVLEGHVTRMDTGSTMPMTSKAFGIPQLEAKAKENMKGLEDMMHCGGEVYIEDAVTKKNRENIGTFSLMKLKTPKDPNDYTITVPQPVGNQD